MYGKYNILLPQRWSS